MTLPLNGQQGVNIACYMKGEYSSLSSSVKSVEVDENLGPETNGRL